MACSPKHTQSVASISVVSPRAHLRGKHLDCPATEMISSISSSVYLVLSLPDTPWTSGRVFTDAVASQSVFDPRSSCVAR